MEMCFQTQLQIVSTFPSYLTGSVALSWIVCYRCYSILKNSKLIPIESDTIVMWRVCAIGRGALCQIEKFTTKGEHVGHKGGPASSACHNPSTEV